MHYLLYRRKNNNNKMGNLATKSDKNNSFGTPNQIKKKTVLSNLDLQDPRSPNAFITRTPILVSYYFLLKLVLFTYHTKNVYFISLCF